jgi:hypothetical protein
MPSKNTTRKNKPSAGTMSKEQQQTKSMASAAKDADDEFISILVKNAPPTRKAKKTAPVKEPEPEPVTPPAPAIPDWEKVGMTQQEFQTMMAKVAKQMAEWQMEAYRQNMVNDLDSVSYWERRIETLEMLREPYNRKPAWSAEDILAVEEIDQQIDECEQNICELEYDMEGGEVEAY